MSTKTRQMARGCSCSECRSTQYVSRKKGSISRFIDRLIGCSLIGFILWTGISHADNHSAEEIQDTPVTEVQINSLVDSSNEVVNTIVEREEEIPLENLIAPDEGGKPFVRRVTAYTSTPEQTDSTPCTGASGEDQCRLWKEGWNICASNSEPINTILWAEGLGYCVIKDRLNIRYKSGEIDWYNGYDEDCLDGIHPGDNCPKLKEAYKIGASHRSVAVYGSAYDGMKAIRKK